MKRTTLLGVTILLGSLCIKSSVSQQPQIIVKNQIGFCIFDYADKDALKKDASLKGSSKDIPIIYFHGTSSSKLEPHVVLEQIKQKKRTVIAFDRPGYGATAFVKFNSLDDYVRWCKQKLMPTIEDILGYKPPVYDLVSVSGGALYSLRTAQAIPQRIRKVSVLSAGLFARPVGQEGHYERARRLAARRPRVAHLIVGFGNRHLDLMQSITAQKFSSPDRQFAACHAQLAKQLYVDATKQGACGLIQDARLQLCDTSYAKPLPKGIAVEIWNGSCDNTISVASAKLLAQRTGVQLQIVENEGHLSSLPITFGNSVVSHAKPVNPQANQKQ